MNTVRTAFAVLFAAALSAAPALAQTPGSTFQDCPDCPEMVVVPVGSFSMGSKLEADQQPVHTVTLKSFAIGKTEVTQAQWMAVMGGNPSAFQEKSRPVEQVSFQDAQAFIEKLNAMTGKQYRLPTEAEWEYAARAGGTAEYPWGDDAAAAQGYAWYDKTSEYTTHPVAQKQPNAFGLYDMQGNVWELTADCYRPSYEGAPVDGSAVAGDASCIRVARGGSYDGGSERLRSAFRYRFPPDFRHVTEGFRLVRSLP
jgi:formylglycine-generating enzyme required for sulfatase activity